MKAVKFLRPYGVYNVDEIATFDKETADELIQYKFAVEVSMKKEK